MKTIYGHINFFKIEKCGLYKTNSNRIYGCNSDETFKLIGEWIKDKPLAATIPWDPSSRSNFSKCYCRDFYRDDDTGDYLLVLWKSESDNAGTLWGAEEDKQTGTGKVVEYTNNHRGQKVIWGRPCYYWVIPTLDTIASIKFEHSLCDTDLFQEYVHKAITIKVKHPNRKKKTTDGGQIRLFYPNENDGSLYRYSFNTHLRSLSTLSAELGALTASITHIIRRDTILADVKDERSDWLKTLNKYLRNVSVDPAAKKRKIEVIAEAQPTEDEVKKIIEEFAKEDRKAKDWNNIGFMDKDRKITWSDRYRLHTSIHLCVNKVEVFDATVLYDQIRLRRDELLAPIISDIKAGKASKAKGKEA